MVKWYEVSAIELSPSQWAGLSSEIFCLGPSLLMCVFVFLVSQYLKIENVSLQISDFFWKKTEDILIWVYPRVGQLGAGVVGVSDETHTPPFASVLSTPCFLPNSEANTQVLCILNIAMLFFLHSLTSGRCWATWAWGYSIPVGVIEFCKFRKRKNPWGLEWMSHLLSGCYNVRNTVDKHCARHDTSLATHRKFYQVSIITPSLQMGKVRLRKFMWSARSHPVSA